MWANHSLAYGLLGCDAKMITFSSATKWNICDGVGAVAFVVIEPALNVFIVFNGAVVDVAIREFSLFTVFLFCAYVFYLFRDLRTFATYFSVITDDAYCDLLWQYMDFGQSGFFKFSPNACFGPGALVLISFCQFIDILMSQHILSSLCRRHSMPSFMSVYWLCTGLGPLLCLMMRASHPPVVAHCP